jgi:hypothetical protein
VKWSLHTRTISDLLRSGRRLDVSYAATGLTRPAALVLERAEIARLIAGGQVLANIQHNTDRSADASDLVTRILGQLRLS